MRLFLTLERSFVQPLAETTAPVGIRYVTSAEGGSQRRVTAMADGRKLGGYVWNDSNRSLYELYVVPGLRGKGIAGKLLDHVVASYGTPIYLHAAPFKKIPDEQGLELAALRNFYVRHGFQPFPKRGEDWMVLSGPTN